ncbi:MAG: response regulator [Candidatus Limnocylindria bacterium]
MKVLAIDDDVALLDFYRQFLTERGHEVLLARNGREGLDLLAQQHPDVVLVDLQMPVMDGREFLKAVDASADSKLPVIVLSSERSIPDAERAPTRAFLPKPFRFDELHRLIDLLGTSR